MINHVVKHKTYVVKHKNNLSASFAPILDLNNITGILSQKNIFFNLIHCKNINFLSQFCNFCKIVIFYFINFFAVYHKARYNTSIVDPCHNSPCSHLCLIIPGGHRCSCPDSQNSRLATDIHCDARKYIGFLITINLS